MTPAAPARRPQRQRREGQDAALAAVVRAHDDDDVLECHDDDERPGDQRKHAQHALAAHGRPGIEALFDGVEGGGSDVAVDNAERAQDEALLRLGSIPRALFRGELRHAVHLVSESACLYTFFMCAATRPPRGGRGC